MTDLAGFYRLFISGGRNISISFPYFSQQNASHFLRRDTVSPLCASLRFCSNTPIDESGSISAKNERLVLISVILGSKTAEVYDFSLIIFACTIWFSMCGIWYLWMIAIHKTANQHFFAWGKSSQGSWEPRCCIRYLSLWTSHQMFLVFHFLFSLHIDHQNYTVVAVNHLTVI